MSSEFKVDVLLTDVNHVRYAKLNQKPMPSREELLARNSFGSVNNNKHLDRMLGKAK